MSLPGSVRAIGVEPLGADVGVDYTHADWAEHVREANSGVGADLIYEMIGGLHSKECLPALVPRGKVIFGALGRFNLAPAALEEMFSRNHSIRGFALLPLLNEAELKTDLAHLFQRAAGGTLKVLQGDRYPLKQAA